MSCVAMQSVLHLPWKTINNQPRLTGDPVPKWPVKAAAMKSTARLESVPVGVAEFVETVRARPVKAREEAGRTPAFQHDYKVVYGDALF
jgi:hypothetical protein